MALLGIKNLKEAGIALAILIALAIGFYVVIQIGGLVVGTTANVATSGTVPVSAAMNTSLAGLEGDYISVSESLSDNWALIGVLAAIVIILIVFGLQKLFKGMGGSGSGSVE